LNKPPCFQEPESKKVIKKLCEENKIDDELLKDLCDVVISFSGSGRKEGIPADITDCIDRFIERA